MIPMENAGSSWYVDEICGTTFRAGELMACVFSIHQLFHCSLETAGPEDPTVSVVDGSLATDGGEAVWFSLSHFSLLL